MKIIYRNIEYVKGIKENFLYIGTQGGFDKIKDFDLFTGNITQNTISRATLESLLNK